MFLWDDWNVAHIAEHGVLPEEAEEAIRNAKAPFPQAGRDEKILVWAATDHGRWLQVVFILLEEERVDARWLDPFDRMEFYTAGGDVSYVVHARDLTDTEKRRLRRMRR